MESERSWPRWLCGLTGHQLVETGPPQLDTCRCLCGKEETVRLRWLERRFASTAVMFAEQIVAWLWRVLP